MSRKKKNGESRNDEQKKMDAAAGSILELLEITSLRLKTGKLRKMFVALAPLISLDPTGELEVRSKNYQPIHKNGYESGKKLLAPLVKPNEPPAGINEKTFKGQLWLLIWKAQKMVTSTQAAAALQCSTHRASKGLIELTQMKAIKRHKVPSPGKGQPRYQYRAVST